VSDDLRAPSVICVAGEVESIFSDRVHVHKQAGRDAATGRFASRRKPAKGTDGVVAKRYSAKGGLLLVRVWWGRALV